LQETLALSNAEFLTALAVASIRSEGTYSLEILALPQRINGYRSIWVRAAQRLIRRPKMDEGGKMIIDNSTTGRTRQQPSHWDSQKEAASSSWQGGGGQWDQPWDQQPTQHGKWASSSSQQGWKK
jgi:hypothetical protein